MTEKDFWSQHSRNCEIVRECRGRAGEIVVLRLAKQLLDQCAEGVDKQLQCSITEDKSVTPAFLKRDSALDGDAKEMMTRAGALRLAYNSFQNIPSDQGDRCHDCPTSLAELRYLYGIPTD